MHCDVISNSLSLSPSITHLDLSYCLRTFDQVLSLANSPSLCTLNYLNLKSCHVSSHGFRVLALSFNLRNLKVLILRNNLISDIKHVLEEDIDMDKIMKLMVLDLTKNKIRGKKVDAMFANTVVLMWGNG